MFKTCKEQYERKIAKGKLTKEYAEKQKRYVGTFLMSEQITQDEYSELMELLTI